MQFPPLAFADASLLFGISAIILLVTIELISPYYGLTNLIVSRKKIIKVAIVTILLFLMTMAIRLIGT